MALTSRSTVLLTSLVLLLAAPQGLRADGAQRTLGQGLAPSTTTRITSAANVTLRAMPSAEAAAVVQVPLGTELTDAGPAGLDKTWTRVKLADGREGWLMTNLTRPLDPVWRWPVFDRIIAERLGRKGDGFAAAAELVTFIERVGGEYTSLEGRAQLDSSRLRAMIATTAAIPTRGGSKELYGSWITAHKTEIVYDAPGGRWMVSSEAIWNVQSKYASTSIADDLAWLAVTNGLSGECEGYLPCYLVARNRLHGEYLRRRAFGRHAADAVTVIRTTAETLAASTKGTASYSFDRKTDCKLLNDTIDALTAAVQGTRVEGKDAALGALAGLRRLCQSTRVAVIGSVLAARSAGHTLPASVITIASASAMPNVRPSAGFTPARTALNDRPAR